MRILSLDQAYDLLKSRTQGARDKKKRKVVLPKGTCPTCSGSGYLNKEMCPRCGGRGKSTKKVSHDFEPTDTGHCKTCGVYKVIHK